MDALIELKMVPQYHGERLAERRKRAHKGAMNAVNRSYGALRCAACNMREHAARLHTA